MRRVVDSAAAFFFKFKIVFAKALEGQPCPKQTEVNTSDLYVNDLQKLTLPLEKEQFIIRDDKLPKLHRHTKVRRSPFDSGRTFCGFYFFQIVLFAFEFHD